MHRVGRTTAIAASEDFVAGAQAADGGGGKLVKRGLLRRQ